MNPGAPVTDILANFLGPQFGNIGRVESVSSSAVRARDLAVTYSYYGGARGRWERRPLQSDELAFDSWGEDTGDLFLNVAVRLRNVPERVWTYEVGGYPVIKKWLGYRDQGRRPNSKLSLTEVDFLTSMVQRIAGIQLIHAKLDLSYERCLQGVIPVEELQIT